MDPAQGSAAGEFIFHNRGERRELFAVAHDVDIGRDLSREVEGTGEQRSSIECDKSLVGSHAGALSSGEDEDGNVGETIAHKPIIHGRNG